MIGGAMGIQPSRIRRSFSNTMPLVSCSTRSRCEAVCGAVCRLWHTHRPLVSCSTRPCGEAANAACRAQADGGAATAADAAVCADPGSADAHGVRAAAVDADADSEPAFEMVPSRVCLSRRFAESAPSAAAARGLFLCRLPPRSRSCLFLRPMPSRSTRSYVVV